MKIRELITGLNIAVTNEENDFINHYGDLVTLNSLDEHAHWVAQSLVRKGIYEIASDHVTLTKN
jgi:hypothetical protein